MHLRWWHTHALADLYLTLRVLQTKYPNPPPAGVHRLTSQPEVHRHPSPQLVQHTVRCTAHSSSWLLRQPMRRTRPTCMPSTADSCRTWLLHAAACDAGIPRCEQRIRIRITHACSQVCQTICPPPPGHASAQFDKGNADSSAKPRTALGHQQNPSGAQAEPITRHTHGDCSPQQDGVQRFPTPFLTLGLPCISNCAKSPPPHTHTHPHPTPTPSRTHEPTHTHAHNQVPLTPNARHT